MTRDLVGIIVALMNASAHYATKPRSATGVCMLVCSQAQFVIDEERR